MATSLTCRVSAISTFCRLTTQTSLHNQLPSRYHSHKSSYSNFSPKAGCHGNAFWWNSQPKICKFVKVLPITHVHKTSMQHFYDFSGVQIFRNADAVHVVKFLQWVWCRVKTNKHISCISEAKFVINGAIKSATLLAHAAFASVNSNSTPSDIKNSAVVDKLRNAILQHNLELSMIAITRRPASAERTACRQFQATGQQRAERRLVTQ